jgi:Ca-activated chloride channel family protein
MGNITFLHPAFFWLFLLLPPAIGWYIWKGRQQTATLTVSSLNGFKAAPSLLAKLKPALFALRLLALSAIIVALARPRTMDVNNRTIVTQGIDIVISLDVSGSMLAKDLQPNRMEAIKGVAAAFVDERPNDRIGLVVYAAESYTKTPVTSDHAIVKQAINSIKYEGNILKDGTDIGIGLATAINRLKASRAKSRIIILLTDGVNNSGFMNPSMASDIAKQFGIKIYTIGVGTNGMAEFPYMKAEDGTIIYRPMKVEIDEQLMKDIATKTDGKYFRATDNNSLKSVYNEINKLETSEIKDTRFYNYDEKFRPFLFIALGLLIVELIVKRTLYRSFI